MTPFRFFALVLLSALVQPTVWSQTAATQAERPSEQVDKLFEKMDRTIDFAGLRGGGYERRQNPVPAGIWHGGPGP